MPEIRVLPKFWTLEATNGYEFDSFHGRPLLSTERKREDA